jgi:hypothetical protein
MLKKFIFILLTQKLSNFTWPGGLIVFEMTHQEDITLLFGLITAALFKMC